MRRWTRLFYYLSINVIVSACTIMVVLTIWDRMHPLPSGELPLPTEADGEASLASAGTAGQESMVFGENPPATSPAHEPTAIIPPESNPDETDEEYEVQAGDTLGAIAVKFDMSIEDLIAANDLLDPNRLEVGQVLIIPRSREIVPTKAALPVEETKTPRPATATPSEAGGEAQVVIDSVVGAGHLASERILIKRTGAGELALAGWQILEEGGNVFTFPKLTLFEGGAVNIHTRAGQSTVVDLYWGLSSPVWQSGETVILLDDKGVARATYRVP
jgi:LysM repeat protein